jgi:peptidoglycan/xylan/chitin deacetylase (PgdA/CDA1 family)
MAEGVMREIVHQGPGRGAEVSLTYDDGPGRSTEEVLGLLARDGARGTFFLVGSEVRRHPDVARRIAAEGHEIGTHTMSHLDHYEVEPSQAVEDMVAGARAVAQVLGHEPRLYRAPYGHFIPDTVAEARRRGWTCVHWSALGMDWMEGESGRSVADRVLPDLQPGAIVLLHDSRRAKPMNPEPVVRATALLLAEIERRGLHPVPVGEMLEQS